MNLRRGHHTSQKQQDRRVCSLWSGCMNLGSSGGLVGAPLGSIPASWKSVSAPQWGFPAKWATRVLQILHLHIAVVLDVLAVLPLSPLTAPDNLPEARLSQCAEQQQSTCRGFSLLATVSSQQDDENLARNTTSRDSYIKPMALLLLQPPPP